MTALVWAVTDGIEDPSIPEDDATWAMLKLQEFTYRRLMHLNKEEMAKEPLEDITINLKIHQLQARKQQADHAIMEEKMKRGMKHGS